MSAVELTARCAPWRNGRVAAHRLRVDVTKGIVGVWDPVAEHYTMRHFLGARSMARIVRLARDKAYVYATFMAAARTAVSR